MSARKKYIHVCLTPALIDQFDVSDSIVVVIDILRATTTMCVAFDNGVQLMVPVEHVEECLPYREKGYLIAGERSGEQLADFDLGNSPFDYSAERVSGKQIAITTTNGTRAIKAAQERGAREVVIGAFCNISILADWLISQGQHVCLICSGWRDHPNLEDTVFAGALARKLRQHFYRFQDSTLMAEAVYTLANRRKRFFLRNSSHFHRLVHLNLQKEVKFAMHRDTHPVLPIMVEDELWDISRHLENYKAYTALLRMNQQERRQKA
jgi:2-phosphosulfolactate phosphatase